LATDHANGQSTVVCLHSSASSSRQWKRLRETWDDHHVVTPDLMGYGELPWSGERPHGMQDEVDAITAVLDSIHQPVHLVGHSFGGAVATLAALSNPDKVRTLTLYEPVLFPLLFEAGRSSGREIWSLQTDVRRLVNRGNKNLAAKRFVDYWNGEAAFKSLPEKVQQHIVRIIPKVASEFIALISSNLGTNDLRALGIPTLLMYGKCSPKPTRDIVELLSGILPRSTVVGIENTGHMGPISEADHVNSLIAAFIRDHAA